MPASGSDGVTEQHFHLTHFIEYLFVPGIISEDTKVQNKTKQTRSYMLVDGNTWTGKHIIHAILDSDKHDDSTIEPDGLHVGEGDFRLRGLELLVWDLDDMEELGLQRCGGSEESQCRSSAGIQVRFWWLEYKQDKNGWEVGVIGTG